MKSSVLALVACSLIATTLCAAAPTTGFRAGAATSMITPPLGRPIVGNFIAPLSTNVHDEMHVRCLVLDDGKTKLALVVLDLLGTEVGMCAETRSLIEKQVGISSSNVLISAVHTHSASSVGGKASAPAEPEYENYRAFVVQRIVDGVRCAANRLRPAQLACLTTQAPEHVFNRR
jgi:neutral ceramidase